MGSTKIQWATDVWNPITGCSPVSAGCDHCYARRMANRLRGRYGYPQDEPFRVTLHPDRLDPSKTKNHPQHWRKPRMIFVSSMGDLFHKDVSNLFINEVFHVMASASVHGHIFVLLTKRAKRMVSLWPFLKKGDYVWPGVSVEGQKTADERIGDLLKVQAGVIVVSYEPALDSLILPSEFLERGKQAWCLTGGETGSGARPMSPKWARQVRDQCAEAGVPFFFKSWGEYRHVNSMDELAPNYAMLTQRHHINPAFCEFRRIDKKQAGRKLEGREYNEVPEGR